MNRVICGIATVGLGIVIGLTATMNVSAVDKKTEIKSLDRVPATLVKLSAEKTARLDGRDNHKIVRVEGFDHKLLSVTAESPTELHIIATKPGCTEMKITYEDGEIEHLVFVVETPTR